MTEAHRIVRPYNFIDLTGQTFGRWTVLSLADKNRGGKTRWFCRCKCGVIKPVIADGLRRKESTGCGRWVCAGKHPANYMHGRSHTPEHNCWGNMIKRCHDTKNKRYKDYGGRGIQVCERWRHDFTAFLADMGQMPTRLHQIERIDNNKGYSPDNCCWATRKEQQANTRTTRLLTINSVTKALTAWAEQSGINVSTLAIRIARGMTPEQAITKPVQPRRVSRPKPATSPQQDSA